MNIIKACHWLTSLIWTTNREVFCCQHSCSFAHSNCWHTVYAMYNTKSIMLPCNSPNFTEILPKETWLSTTAVFLVPKPDNIETLVIFFVPPTGNSGTLTCYRNILMIKHLKYWFMLLCPPGFDFLNSLLLICQNYQQTLEISTLCSTVLRKEEERLPYIPTLRGTSQASCERPN